MRKFLIIFLILLTIPLVYSQEIEFYVIGLTPPERSGCVIPGQVAKTMYIITSNSTTNETLGVQVSNVSWVQAENYITVPPNGTYELDVYASPPDYIVPDVYSAEVYVCTMPPETGLAVATCLRGIYHVNVTYSCEMPGVTIIDIKRAVQLIAIVLIAVLGVLLLYKRKFGSTYLKKKKK